MVNVGSGMGQIQTRGPLLMPTVVIRLSQRVSYQLVQAARTGPVKTLSRLGTSLTHVWIVSRSDDELFNLSCTLESNLQMTKYQTDSA